MHNLRQAVLSVNWSYFLLTVPRWFLSCNFYMFFLVDPSVVYMGCLVFYIKCVIVRMFMSRLHLLAWDGYID